MDALTPKNGNNAPQSSLGGGSVGGDDHIQWFRHASPYINAHREKVFVICFSGTALNSAHFGALVHDITLLRNLGVKLVLVYGLRNQIDAHLAAKGIKSDFVSGLRITDDPGLDALISEVGKARIKIESRLSMGLPNTPMSGAHLSVASGNFVTAQPWGVRNGIDFRYTGTVRQVHTGAIRRQIDNGQLVLLSPIGYSRTGEVFNLAAEDIAMRTAQALSAEKLIYITDQVIQDENGQPIRESTPTFIDTLLSQLAADAPARRVLSRAIEACRGGVNRVHILAETNRDALLKELFTRDGSGTMINADTYEATRQAKIDDVGGIIELIRPLEENGTLIRRSREQLEIDISQFYVAERDGTVIACAALLPDSDTSTGCAEIACVVTHPDYRNGGRAEVLLDHLQGIATHRGLETLYALTTRSIHWFIEQGFEEATVDQLTVERRQSLNIERGSKVLIKRL